MRAKIRLLKVLILSVITIQATQAQQLFEQAYKFEQVLEYIDRYYVEVVDEDVLVDNAVQKLISDLEADSLITTPHKRDQFSRYLEAYDTPAILPQALFWIDENISDTINQEKLVEKTIAGLLYELDPHTSYLSREEVARLNEPLQGNFEGIGVSFNILNDTIYIVSPIESGPSAKVGIMAGDRIVKVDGKNVAGIGITTQMVYDLLRGRKGTRVNVSILRRGVASLIDFEITRDKIPIYSVDASYRVDENTGYIKINRFSLTTMDEFSAAMKNLKSENIENLIIDLTGNGGGYLDVAINMADEFLEEEKLILFTEGVHSLRKEYYATRKGSFENGHLVILIDEGSASASEILSGAIQDWDKGIIVGRRSYGKGLVQRPLQLIDRSMIRLTIARYYTPSGRLIQKPYNSDRETYESDLQTRLLHGEFVHRDSIQFPDSLRYFTLRKTRPVYGGGGIMPDYFVPIDTSYYSEYYRQIIRRGLLNQYVLEYVDQNRNDILSRFPAFEKYKNEFEVDEDLMAGLIDYTTKEDVIPEGGDLEISGSQIKMLIKAYIARDLWSGSEFFEITNEQEPDFIMAMKILKNWNKYEAMLLNSN